MMLILLRGRRVVVVVVEGAVRRRGRRPGATQTVVALGRLLQVGVIDSEGLQRLKGGEG